MNEIVLQNKNGEVLASSREVAERFGKRHDKLTSEIKRMYGNLIGSTQNGGHPFFIENLYENNQNHQTYTEFLMNRDGFSLLVMGFTGKEALEWKLKYIEAFNKMEEIIKQGNYLSDEEKWKLQLFSKDPLEVVTAHNNLVSIEVGKATAPLIAENQEMKPKAEFHDAVSVAENCTSFGDFAGIFQNNNKISFGRNKIMNWCRNRDYLCSSFTLKNKPSQQMLDSGYMKYKENIDVRNGKQYITYMPMLTGKGQIWLTKKLLKYFKEAA